MIIKKEVNGKILEFEVEIAVYNKYVNEMMPNNKVAPAKNFLMRSVKADFKEDLTELLKLPGAAIQIAAAVIEDFAPDIEITVGK